MSRRPSQFNHSQLLVDLLLLTNVIPVPERILITHDKWCGSRSGKLCNCDPRAKFSDANGKVTRAQLCCQKIEDMTLEQVLNLIDDLEVKYG